MKRNLISLITAISIICSIIPIFRASASAEDLTISTLAELEELRIAVNGGTDYAGETIILTADIDMSENYGEEKSSWTPIGNSTNEFAGTFDGGGHTIKGLYINTDSRDNQGLFGYCTGTIKNITVKGSVTGKRYVGGIAGRLKGGIAENCHNNAAINANSTGGGIVGYALESCNVTGCSNTADITVKGKAGGIVGNGKSIIKDCFNTGKITAVSSASFQDGAGGIAGWLTAGGSVEKCFNKGDVVLNGGAAKIKDNLGGIAGFNAGTISDCYNAGLVRTEDENVIAGGIVGNSSGAVRNCYNTGAVSGAVTGNNTGTVTNCYYLDGTCSGADKENFAEKKTSEQFASGEVAWLLQNGQPEQMWGQDITSSSPDAYPMLTSIAEKKVLKVTFAVQTNLSYAVVYTNAGGKAAIPDAPVVDDDTLVFSKWSNTNSADGEEFTAETAVTEDMTVYAVIEKKPGKAEGTGSVAMANYHCGDTAVNPAASSATNGTDSVTYQYKEQDADDSAYDYAKPLTAGEYTVRAVFAETEDYTAVTAVADFTVSHSYSDSWSMDLNNHWHECVCGGKSDSAAHSYTYSAKDNVITGICSDCGNSETAEIVITNNIASINYSGGWQGGSPAVVYKKDGSIAADISEPGTYTVSVSIGEVTAQKQFTIAGPSPSPTASPSPSPTVSPSPSPTASPSPSPTASPSPSPTASPSPSPTASPSPSPTAKPKRHSGSSSSKATPLPEFSPAPTATPAPAEITEFLKHSAYMAGNDDGTFNPDGNITRAEITAVLARLTDGFDENGSYQSGFTDVAEGLWYYKYIGFAENKNVISGYEDGTFKPESAVTRAEFAALIAKHAHLSGSNEADTFFTDIDGHWAYEQIKLCYESGYIRGYEDGTFRPDNAITRAEAVKSVNMYLGRGTDKAGLAAADYRVFPDVAASHWAYCEIIEAANDHTYEKGTTPEKWVE